MNIQKVKRQINQLLISYFFLTTLSCSMGKPSQGVVEVYTAIEVDSNFQHSDESLFRVGQRVFSLRSKSCYDSDGVIREFILFKPEGLLRYSKEQLATDKQLMEHHQVYFSQDWLINGNLIDIGDRRISVRDIGYNIWEARDDSTMVVTLYKIK